MANTVFKLRRSSVAGKVPNTSTLSIGELGLNLTDKILYSSDGSSVFEIGANNSSYTTNGNISLATNDKRLSFRPLAGGSNVYFTQQSDDNFVFYSTNTSNGPRAVWSIFANSVTSNLNLSVPVNFNNNVGLTSTAALYANGSPGSAAQVLSSNGSSTYWATLAALATNTSAQYTWTNTHTFQANVSFTGSGLAVNSNTGSVYFGGISDANWRISRNAGVTTKYFYTNNTLDIIAASSSKEGIVFGWTGNSYLEIGYAGTYTTLPIYVGNSSVNTTINATSFTGTSNNSLYLGGTVAASYVQNTDSRTLSGNLTFTGANLVVSGTNTYISSNTIIGSANSGTFYSINGQVNATSGNFIANAYATLSGAGGNYLAFGQQTNFAQWIQSGYSAVSPVYYSIILNPLGGNIGIGNTVPTDKLSVNGTTYLGGNVSSSINLTVNTAGVYHTGVVNAASLYSTTNTATIGTTTYFASNGNVGIGNSTPANRLSINGLTTLYGLASNTLYIQASGADSYDNAHFYIIGDNYTHSATNVATSVTGMGVQPRMSSDNTGSISVYGTWVEPKVYATGNGQIYSTGANFYATRGFANDTSSNTTSVLSGFNSYAGHNQTVNASAFTGTVYGASIAGYIYKAAANLVYGAYNQAQAVGVGAVANANILTASYNGILVGTYTGNSTVTNAYAMYASGNVGTSATGYGTLTNYYDAYLDGVTVNARGTVTNKYGVYQTKSDHINYFAGNIGIGNTAPTNKLSVNGTTYFGGNITFGSSGISANGSYGSAGQSLLSNGSATYWATAGATLNANNTDTQTFYIGLSNASSGAWTNAVVSTTKLYYVPNTGTLTATAFSGNGSTITSVNAAAVGGNTASTLRTYTDDRAANAYSNSVSYTDSKILTANAAIIGNAATAYTNAVSYVNGLKLDSVTNTSISYIPVANTVKNAYDRAIDANTRAASAQTAAASAYTNSVSYTDGKILTANAAITGNAATAYTNAVSYTDSKILTANAAITGNAATAYTNSVSYTDSKILTANAAITGNAATAYTNAIAFASNASNINTGTLAEARLPYRMNQNLTSSNNVTFGSLTLTGNLTVSGNVTVIGANTLSVVDNMIYLNANNTTQNIDVGIVANYNSGAYAHTGIFRDASDGYWKVFDNYLPEPDANVNINTTNTSFHLANFQANNFYAGNTSTNWLVVNTAGTYHTGTINAASHTVGTSFTANSTLTNTVSLVVSTNTATIGTGTYFVSNGNVGIGTSSPTQKLDVRGAAVVSSLTVRDSSFANAYCYIHPGASNTSTGYFASYNSDATRQLYMGFSTSGAIYGLMGDVSGKDVILGANSVEVVRMSANGNVGIGDASPTNKLSISDNANNTNGLLAVYNANTGSSARAMIYLQSDTGSGQVGTVSNTWNADGRVLSKETYLYGSAGVSILSGGTGHIRFANATLEQMRISSNGNVGIGITTPNTKFHVYSNTIGAVARFEGNHVDSAGVIGVHNANNGTYGTINAMGPNGFAITSWANSFVIEGVPIDANAATVIGTYRGDLVFQTETRQDRMTIAANGFVGVGLSNPSNKLTINGGLLVAAQGNVSVQGAHIMWNKSSGTGATYIINQKGGGAGGIYFGESNTSDVFTENMRISANGFVGIGNTSPAEKIQIDGNIYAYGARAVTINPSLGSINVKAPNSGWATGLTFTGSSGTDRGGIGAFGSSDSLTYYWMGSAYNGANNLILTYAGNVGIGNTAPAEKLGIAPDTDVSAEIGRAHVGYVGFADYAGFSHVDQNGTTGYALVQGSGGDTYLNAASGNPIRFRQGNADRMTLDANGNFGIGTTTPAYKLQVNGSFAAVTKSFVIDHPTKPDMKLRYASLEGPENGVYVRGKINDYVIKLPDYWEGLVDEDTISVQLTPYKRPQNPYIVKVEKNKVHILNSDDTMPSCYYTVYAERKDVEKLVVEF